ncbi:MAG: GDSL-type esterase/lipase family protein [bacterium]|nr:GDSL-type esterase/lipase family protein [bacterium]
MKRLLILIAVLLAIVGAFFLFGDDLNSNKNVKNYPSSGIDIIAFGDSLVEGVGSTPGNDFVSVLSRKLDMPILNLGVAGDTTASGLLRFDKALDSDPKLVLILLGGNDYLRKVSKEQTFSNLRMMIESTQQKGSIVILLGVRGGLLKDNYKDDYKELAKEYDTAYIPNVLDGLIGTPDLMYDSIHPNDKGYEIIADRIYPVLVGLIN